MRAYIRVCVLAGLLLAAGGLAPGASAAVPDPTVVAEQDDCTRGADDYGAELPCEVDLEILTPVCDNDVPKLRYAVAPVGSDSTTVTVTFVNPGGPDVVYADQPLSGTVLWPGAVTDGAGNPLDWPGWRLENGTWVQGDEYDWVRPSVEVAFQVNPTASAVVAYPPSSPVCVSAPESSQVLAAGDEQAEVLSVTGASAGPVALVAGGLLLAGAAAVLGVRRRRV